MKTEIAWTDFSWNPVRGCSRVSEGCRNCYAERMAARFAKPGEPFHGFAKVTAPRDGLDRVGGRRNGWTGRVELIPSKLDEPLRWRKPRRVFVNSMSDLFHEALRDEHVAHVFGVMAAAPQHTFQVLTKRPERMRRWFEWIEQGFQGAGIGGTRLAPAGPSLRANRMPTGEWPALPWPLPNVWLGVSCEDQATADERIPLLLQTPAAARFISAEPLLGPVDFQPLWSLSRIGHCEGCGGWVAADPVLGNGHDNGKAAACGPITEWRDGIDWVIVGGESGPGARPCDVAWVRSVVRQCREAGVPVFVKQLGARPYDSLCAWKMLDRRREPSPDEAARLGAMKFKHPKGGDPDEWPEDLRVREFPR